jgi:hypothetical protein
LGAKISASTPRAMSGIASAVAAAVGLVVMPFSPLG